MCTLTDQEERNNVIQDTLTGAACSILHCLCVYIDRPGREKQRDTIQDTPTGAACSILHCTLTDQEERNNGIQYELHYPVQLVMYNIVSASTSVCILINQEQRNNMIQYEHHYLVQLI